MQDFKLQDHMYCGFSDLIPRNEVSGASRVCASIVHAAKSTLEPIRELCEKIPKHSCASGSSRKTDNDHSYPDPWADPKSRSSLGYIVYTIGKSPELGEDPRGGLGIVSCHHQEVMLIQA